MTTLSGRCACPLASVAIPLDRLVFMDCLAACHRRIIAVLRLSEDSQRVINNLEESSYSSSLGEASECILLDIAHFKNLNDVPFVSGSFNFSTAERSL